MHLARASLKVGVYFLMEGRAEKYVSGRDATLPLREVKRTPAGVAGKRKLHHLHPQPKGLPNSLEILPRSWQPGFCRALGCVSPPGVARLQEGLEALSVSDLIQCLLGQLLISAPASH